MTDQPDHTEPTPPSFDPAARGSSDSDDVNDALRRQLDASDDRPADAADRINEPLRNYGSYKSIRQIGEGGQGVVVLAEDTASGDTVAVKAMLADQAGDSRIRHEFVKNARHLEAMRHPNIMPVLHIDDNDECPFMVMPFVEGGSLAEKARPGRPMNLLRLLPVAIQVAEALVYAHDKRGVIHRDIKPENVLIEKSGHAYLCDFGLVKTVFNDTIQTGQRPIGWTVGTRPYMAPEVVNGNAGDMRVDIYSFGAMLYQLVTGRVPYTGNDTAEVFAKIKVGPPPPPKELNPDLPDPWAVVIEAAMARELDDRYAHVSHLLADLKRLEAGEPPRGNRQSEIPAAAKPSRAPRKAKANTGMTKENNRANQSRTGSGKLKAFAGIALALVVLGGGGFLAWNAGFFEQPVEPIPVPPKDDTRIPEAPPPDAAATPEEAAFALREAIRNSDYSAVIEHGKAVGRLGVTAEFLKENGLVAPMIQAAARGDAQLFDALLQVKELRIFGVHGDDGLEPIHVAASSGHIKIVAMLVNTANIPANRRSALTGTTPLQEAVAAGQCALVQPLKDLGADINATSRDSSRTALHSAAANRQLGCVEALLNAGAAVDAADFRRKTPLHVAAEEGDSAIAELLLRFGADATRTDQRGKRPADLAFDAGYDDLARVLGF